MKAFGNISFAESFRIQKYEFLIIRGLMNFIYIYKLWKHKPFEKRKEWDGSLNREGKRYSTIQVRERILAKKKKVRERIPIRGWFR